MRLQDRLRALREDAGLSVRQAAAELGKSPGYISRIEGRGEVPSTKLLCEMSVLYEIEVEELLDLAKVAQLEATKSQIEAKQSEALRLFRKDQNSDG